jgi:hypothetical protein
MKRTRTREAGKEPKKVGAVPEKALKRVDLNAVREQITNLVASRAVDMVESAIADAEKGHYPAVKYLFEMVGFCPAAAPDGAIEEDSLAKILLRRLKLPEETNPGTEVTKECARDAVQPKGDAVE